MIMPRLANGLFHLLRHPLQDKRGNVLMMTAFALIPLMLSIGITVDYARAGRLQTKLNAAADAAALAAVTEPMMRQTNTVARTAATNMYKVLTSGQPGLVASDADLTVTVTGNDSVTSTRTAIVRYKAKSTNVFAAILGIDDVTLAGSATATATAAPNIDFYLALDTSPSMALPTTSAGITLLDNAVHCSFACHSNKMQVYGKYIYDNSTFAVVKGSYSITGSGANSKQQIDAAGTYVYPNNRTAPDPKCRSGGRDICIYNSDGTFVSSYWWAVNRGIKLRITDERLAASNLMTTAQNYAAANNTTYRAALYTFDHKSNPKTIAPLTSDLAAVGAAASMVDLVKLNDQAGNGRPPNGESGTEYLFTSFQEVLTRMSNTMPAVSGKGTKDPGDTPQSFLFIVTDGMSDENIGFGRTRSAMLQQQIDQCTAIKARGIKIAILYTEYTKESIADDEPFQRGLAEAAIPNIAPKLTACASPELLFTVRTDQSITDALQALFTKAVASARLTQ